MTKETKTQAHDHSTKPAHHLGGHSKDAIKSYSRSFRITREKRGKSVQERRRVLYKSNQQQQLIIKIYQELDPAQLQLSNKKCFAKLE